MSYAIPRAGISEVPDSGSPLLRSLVQILESAHHKHTLQDMLRYAKEPYFACKRDLYYPKRDLLMLLQRPGMPL
jgi:hypothetical protein